MPKRHGKRLTNSLRHIAWSQSISPLETPGAFLREYFHKHRRAIREMQRTLLSKTTTLAAIKAAESGKVTEVSIDDL